MLARNQVLFSVNITMLNDSKRLLNKKWLCPVICKSNASIDWKAKRNTFLPAIALRALASLNMPPVTKKKILILDQNICCG